MQCKTNHVRGWTTPADVRAQVQKLWDRGELLAALVSGQSPFPKRFGLRVPSSSEMMERFNDVRVWIQDLQAMHHCRLEMREFKHRVLGPNTFPDEIWIETIKDALAVTGKQREAAHFMAVLELTRERQPELLEWLSKRPFQALDLYEKWGTLLEVVAWLKEHPRPAVYLRQVDIPGIDSKFLEAHCGVLSELLDIALPPKEIDFTASGATQFAKRYGFLEKPIRIRFRVLDSKRGLFSNGVKQDITLDGDSFNRLELKISRVFITENEVNFLAFPNMDDSIIIFGAGYGFTILDKTEWLSRCRVYYWGDIDTHGFAILDQLRSHLGEVRSFLMDRATLLQFESQWGVEEKQTVRDLIWLNDEERSLYDDLRDNRIRRNLRLEQERIGFGWVQSTLSALA